MKKPSIYDSKTLFTKATSVNYKYNEEERKLLNSFDSMDYLPPHSKVSSQKGGARRPASPFQVYTSWLEGQPDQLAWEQWLMMGIIGVATGLTGFLLHQLIEAIADFKWDFAKIFLLEEHLPLAWLSASAFSLLLVLFSTAFVVLISPSAAGSGTPELISFLNGTMIKQFFSIKTFIVKFASCTLAVGAGLPVGPEGPMIHLGSIIGASLSQFQPLPASWLPWFNRCSPSCC